MILLRNFVAKLFYSFWNKWQWRKWNKLQSNVSIFVVDIDNTLTISTIGEPINHINPYPNLSMINWVKEMQKKGNKIVFLSARSPLIFNQTYNWLTDQALINSKNDLFHVLRAKDKIKYLQALILVNSKVTYIDDLSFNHENGEVKYYTKVIQKIKLLELNYLGLDFIKSI